MTNVCSIISTSYQRMKKEALVNLCQLRGIDGADRTKDFLVRALQADDQGRTGMTTQPDGSPFQLVCEINPRPASPAGEYSEQSTTSEGLPSSMQAALACLGDSDAKLRFQLILEYQKAVECQAEREAAERQAERQLKLELARLDRGIASPAPTETREVSQPMPSFDKFPMMDERSGVDRFFRSFEKVCLQYQLPDIQWAKYLTPGLRGKALDVFADLPMDCDGDYAKIKAAIIKSYNLTPDMYRKRFRTLQRGPTDSYTDVLGGLRSAFKGNLVPGHRKLSPSWKSPKSSLPRLSAANQMPAGENTHPSGAKPSTADVWRCYVCNKTGNISLTCPDKKKSGPPRKPSSSPPDMYCVATQPNPHADNLQPVKIGENTGAQLTLVRPELVDPQDILPGKTTMVTVIGGVSPTVPMACVYLDWGAGCSLREVGLSDSIPANVLLGTDLGRMTSQYEPASTPTDPASSPLPVDQGPLGEDFGQGLGVNHCVLPNHVFSTEENAGQTPVCPPPASQMNDDGDALELNDTIDRGAPVPFIAVVTRQKSAQNAAEEDTGNLIGYSSPTSSP
ncbi:uncharacterized protein LOC121008788 [Bufo bufo]|uniref:uncharacterized protein LOC121008788 n=1 Tax=Bufo bufo TaxID=8384 RepID=UPI001ABDB2B1|nr:uncharacterized protein LOC121008788 [Bufo bufo]